jgi:hypothetical protein
VLRAVGDDHLVWLRVHAAIHGDVVRDRRAELRMTRRIAVRASQLRCTDLAREQSPPRVERKERRVGRAKSFAPLLALAATIAETTLGILLIAGFKPRWTGLASAILLALFGIAMTISGGIKSALHASVFSASAAALLLAAVSTTVSVSGNASRD